MKNARFLPPFSAKNTDAEPDFLDIALIMILKSLLDLKNFEIEI
ncbi:hypothetical protein [Anaerocolumna aminovalerica]|nr:hypothetical protein [Anaerocolumna aminovalerica]